MTKQFDFLTFLFLLIIGEMTTIFAGVLIHASIVEIVLMIVGFACGLKLSIFVYMATSRGVKI